MTAADERELLRQALTAVARLATEKAALAMRLHEQDEMIRELQDMLMRAAEE